MMYVRFLILLPVFICAQASDTLWTRVYGGPADDYGYSCAVSQANDGGFVIVGYTWSFGAGYWDVWIIRIDANGDTIETETYGGVYSDWAMDVQQTSDGGHIIGGGTWSYGLGVNGWLIKIDSIGDTLWTRCCGGGLAWLNAVWQTSDGGYIAAGGNDHPRGVYAYLVRTDSLGFSLWDSVYYHGGGIYPSAIGYSVLQTADGGYVIAGECDGCFYFFKTDPQGNTLWYNMDSVGTVQSILQTNDGGFILVGYTIDDWNMFDVYIARSDSDGNILWTREYGGGCDDVANAIQQISDGGYIITGHTDSFGPGFEDVWLLRTDASGETLWTETYGGITSDVGNNVQQAVDGGYIIVGSTASFGAGGNDIYIIKTEPDVGIEENKPAAINNKEITSTVFRGTLQLPGGMKCIVYDITGRFVEPSTIKPGIYFIEVDGVVVQKVVKVR